MFAASNLNRVNKASRESAKRLWANARNAIKTSKAKTRIQTKVAPNVCHAPQGHKAMHLQVRTASPENRVPRANLAGNRKLKELKAARRQPSVLLLHSTRPVLTNFLQTILNAF